MTLPVIYALKQANSADREKMIKIIKDDNFSVEDFKTLVGMLEKYGGTDYTEKMAAVYIQAAKGALSRFNPSQSKETMFDIADYVLLRRV
jgi:geranylgeranyl pyrophosphate synthase